jgi:hypothetical protein
VLFPTPLPRYMLPSLPLLCALAALGVRELDSPARQAVAACATIGLLLFGMQGAWFMRDVPHMEVSMAYRRMLAWQKQAAELVAGLAPRGVVTTFPMAIVLTAPPEDGFLSAPVPVLVANRPLSLAELCKNDLLVEAQDDAVAPAIAELRKKGALSFLLQVGPQTPRGDVDPPEPLHPAYDAAIRIYRIHCDGQ